MRHCLAAACALMALFFVSAAAAQSDLRAAPTTVIAVQALPPAPSPQAGFDPVKATNAYLAEVNGAARARSNAYFEGGYWLILIDMLYAVGVAAVLMWLRISARLRNLVGRITGVRFLQVPIYTIGYIVLATAMTFPLTLYEEFYREHAYGLSNQDFPQWFGDFGTGFGVNLVQMVVLITIVYALIRGAPRTWWVWGALITTALLAVVLAVSPVFVAPLFNHYQPLPNGPLKTEILTIARSEGVPAKNVYEFDASRQSKRVSANVSGMFGTTRISMNDNLLKRCTPDEIIAVLGHEMGHYVLDHAALLITWFGLLTFAGFAFVAWGYGVATGFFGDAWDVHAIADIAGLPVLMALFSIFMLISTPVSNTISRTVEAQADIFGLNAVRKPDGFARAALIVSDYRKLDPGPLEEFVFYDHPSGRARIAMAMRWKAGHLNDLDIKNGPVSPQ